ncbi:bifunctional diaminohydroxyphosphoribosylaminopyrimidine deaminase/5-amino-6-(5-phosphoribosylamino)uracil reductase RibD [soil metagenome]
MAFSPAEQAAMIRALELAQTPGVPIGPNPRVGCVMLSPDGTAVAEGRHGGAGSPHAEIDALRSAGERARGATAVVTLEPCNHTGRTGPCSQALLAAGVARVVFAQSDVSPVAAGGAAALRSGGVDVEGGLMVEAARAVNRVWAFAVEHERPLVTWKFATTLDGRSAAADGSSRWISSQPARRDAHRLRSLCDTILVGTSTVLIDDPQLTVRDDDDVPLPRERQPLRAVMGQRALPAERRVLDEAADTAVLKTRDPHQALAELFNRDRQHILLEGGPTLAAGFLKAGRVDEVVTYVAPMLLGAGRSAVGDLGIETIADALQLHVSDVTVLGEPGDTNVRVTMQILQLRETGS